MTAGWTVLREQRGALPGTDQHRGDRTTSPPQAPSRCCQGGVPGAPANARGSACFVHGMLRKPERICASEGAALDDSSPAIAIANGKLHESFVEAFTLGVLCNVLVCLAVWMA
ncbi:MAG: hypothetical protein EPO40_15770, partial [Myxococcaceae bacterium]